MSSNDFTVVERKTRQLKANDNFLNGIQTFSAMFRGENPICIYHIYDNCKGCDNKHLNDPKLIKNLSYVLGNPTGTTNITAFREDICAQFKKLEGINNDKFQPYFTTCIFSLLGDCIHAKEGRYHEITINSNGKRKKIGICYQNLKSSGEKFTIGYHVDAALKINGPSVDVIDYVNKKLYTHAIKPSPLAPIKKVNMNSTNDFPKLGASVKSTVDKNMPSWTNVLTSHKQSIPSIAPVVSTIPVASQMTPVVSTIPVASQMTPVVSMTSVAPIKPQSPIKPTEPISDEVEISCDEDSDTLETISITSNTSNASIKSDKMREKSPPLNAFNIRATPIEHNIKSIVIKTEPLANNQLLEKRIERLEQEVAILKKDNDNLLARNTTLSSEINFLKISKSLSSTAITNRISAPKSTFVYGKKPTKAKSTYDNDGDIDYGDSNFKNYSYDTDVF
jgi:hypothetical protein